ncbi:hypothetical protein APA99_35345 [Pseudomonas aeruginosa]|nr:hypothetical protein APA99_35345 [Pseudomonas aeruginosa]
MNGGALFNAEFGIRHRGSTVPERSGVALSFCRRPFSSLSMVTKPRKEFVERFAREKIMKALAEDIIFVVRGEVK